MKIEVNSGSSFTAKVDKTFIKNAQTYYLKRNLPIQSNRVGQFAEKLETYGSANSEILYRAKPLGKGFMHILFLKNTDINKKQALVLTFSKKFTEVVDFFINITDKYLMDMEKIL